MTDAGPRILLVGDVMTDVIVRPEGPLARAPTGGQGSSSSRAAWGRSGGVAPLILRHGRFRRPRRRVMGQFESRLRAGADLLAPLRFVTSALARRFRGQKSGTFEREREREREGRKRAWRSFARN